MSAPNTPYGTRVNSHKSNPTTFHARGLWNSEKISINEKHVVYQKKTSFFSPVFTITVLRENIRDVQISRTISGLQLIINTLSNTSIVSGNFSSADANRIRAALIA
jgi:hypothetical protein